MSTEELIPAGQHGHSGVSGAFGANGVGPFNPTGGSSSSAFQYITGNGATLIVGENSVETSLGAFSGTLPALSTVQPGQSVYVNDASSNMGVNNYTVNVNAADNASGIILGGAAGVDSIALSNSDQVSKFISLGVGNGWRLIYYGV